MHWMVAGDMAVGVAIPVGAMLLYKTGRIELREVYFLLWGTLIGLAFEAFIFLGPITICGPAGWPLPRGTVVLFHSSWDGGLFMAGFYFAKLVLRKPARETCAKYDWRELTLMVVWGTASAFVVELSGNGALWEYQQQSWNPVWITLGDQGYTAFIQIVWLIVPFVFYFGALWISHLQGDSRRRA